MTASPTPGSQPDERSLSRAMFLYGFAMFMLVYMAQPLMPLFVAEFAIAPAVASQALSAATAGMALFLIPAALYADRFARKPLLVSGLIMCALLSVASVWISSFEAFVGLRFAFGVVLAALPATALAYLAEAVDPAHLGRSVGMYIAGNAMGGMSGRLLALTLTEWMDWRMSLACMGLIALLVAVHVASVLPMLDHVRASDRGHGTRSRLSQHLRDPGLRALFAMAFLLSGCIVSVYNYISFRLSAPPYSFGFTTLCGIYALYVVGMLGSARVGRMADRFGRGRVMIWLPVLMGVGVLMTLSSQLLLIVAGIALLTFGFFAGHSVASGWVSARAQGDRALASSLYLTMYYLGASVLGTASGAVWAAGGWTGVVALVSTTLLIALALTVWLARLRPLQPYPNCPASRLP